MKYKVELTVNSEQAKEIKEIAEIFCSDRFQNISIKIDPDDLLPERLHQSMKKIMLSVIRLLKDIDLDERIIH